jgi:predicted phosphodiesterase
MPSRTLSAAPIAQKLRLILKHHAGVMGSLARFLAAGNSLVIVQGNHDVDWHWRGVQREFRRALEKLAPVPRDAVTFASWFYYEPGVVYLEHGHQYDPCCSYDHVLYPVSSEDPRRTARSLADVLLRYIVRPTRGMLESGHDDASFLDYLRFTGKLGVRGAVALAARFVRANRVLLRLWRLRLHGASARVKAVRRRRLRALGAAYQVSLKRLERLARLQRAPATQSLAAIVTSVMLDRVLLVTFFLLLTAALAVAAPWWAMLLVVPLTFAAGLIAKGLLPVRNIAPSAMLRERSLRVAKLFPAAIVVMGHTHLPEMRTNQRTTYVNLGAWAEEDAPDGDTRVPMLPATRTHLVLLRAEDGVMAELRTWRTGGPEPFEGSDSNDG